MRRTAFWANFPKTVKHPDPGSGEFLGTMGMSHGSDHNFSRRDHESAEELAAFERVSVEEFVSANLSEQFAGLKYLNRRAERASLDKFRRCSAAYSGHRARRIRSVLTTPNSAVAG